MTTNHFNNKQNRYQYTGEKALAKDYGTAAIKALKPDDRNSLFGTPENGILIAMEAEKTDFYRNNIESVTVEGFGKNSDQSHTLWIHKKLRSLVLRIFQHIKALNLLMPPTRRYRLNPDRTVAYEHRHNSKKSLSTHAWGIAIDLNRSENRDFSLKAASSLQNWAIPHWVVKIFELHGFYWGGYRADRQKEPSHFEYCQPTIREPVPLSIATFPFAKDKWAGASPLAYYSLNESAVGGYYPLAMNSRALHAGIHLTPEKQKRQTVRASLPGTIIAACLTPTTKTTSDESIEYLGNYSGFILVKHQLEIVDTKERYTFHTLYMNLRPIDFTKVLSEEPSIWNHVPWIQKLFQHKHGSVLCLNSDNDAGRVLRLREPFKENRQALRLFPEGEWSTETVNRGDGKGPGFFHRPTPENLEAILKTFETGKTIVFDDPFLTVEPGELIGYVKSPKEVGKAPLVKFRDYLPETIKKQFRSGFLHWEMFTAADSNLWARLFELEGVDKTEVRESLGMNNLLSKEEWQRVVKAFQGNKQFKSQREERLKKLYESSLKLNGDYTKELVTLMNNPADFAKSEKTDLLTGQQLESEKLLPQNRHTYPIHLEVETTTDPVNSESQPVTLRFDNKSKQVTIELSPTKKGETCSIQIPANASKVEIQSEKFHLVVDQIPVDDSDLFRETIAYRWRNTILTHGNEWDIDNLEALSKAIADESGEFESQENLNSFSLSWMGSDKDQKSVHPVTALWMLNRLRKQGAIQIRDDWQEQLPESKQKLLYLAWGSEAKSRNYLDWHENRQVPYGSKSYPAILYQQESNREVELIAESEEGERVTLCQERCEKGVLLRQLPFTFWGKWTLKAYAKTPTGDLEELSPQKRVSTTVTGIKPEFAPLPSPKLLKGNQFNWLISFKSGCPEMLQGLIRFQYQIATQKSWDQAEEFIMSKCGQYIVGVKQLKEWKSDFFYPKYFKKRERTLPFKLSWKLVESVRNFEKSCGVEADILKLDNSTGCSVLVRINGDEKAIEKGVQFLEADEKKATPLFTANSKNLQVRGISQGFYLEVDPDDDRFEVKESQTFKELLIPVESEKYPKDEAWLIFDSEEKYYLGVQDKKRERENIGRAFTFKNYQDAQRRIRIRQGVVATLAYLERIAGSLKKPILSDRTAKGLEVTVKAASKKQKKTFSLLWSLKKSTTLPEKDKNIFTISVTEKEQKTMLLEKNSEEKEKIQAIIKTYFNAESDKKRRKSYYSAIKASFQGKSDEFGIEASLLDQFLFLRKTLNIGLSIKSLDSSGTKLSFTAYGTESTKAFQKKLGIIRKFHENLNRMKTFKGDQLLLVFSEKSAGRFYRGSTLPKSYKWSDFKEKSPTTVKTKISRDLVLLINQFRNDDDNIPIGLNYLSEDGLIARIEPWISGKLKGAKKQKAWIDINKRFYKKFERLKKESCYQSMRYLNDSGEIELQIKEATKISETSGNLTVKFDGTALFKKILEKVPITPNQMIWLSCEMIALNGGHSKLNQKLHHQKNDLIEPVEVKGSIISKNAIAASSNVIIKRMIRPQFGDIYYRLQPDGKEVFFSVNLLGDLAEWEAVKPEIEIDLEGKKIKLPYSSGRIVERLGNFTTALSLVKKENGKTVYDEQIITKKVTVTAKVGNSTATVQGIKPASTQPKEFAPLKPTLSIEEVEMDEATHKIRLHFNLFNWPKSRDLKLYLEKQDKDGKYQPVSLQPEVSGSSQNAAIVYFPKASPRSIVNKIKQHEINGSPDQSGLTVFLSPASLGSSANYRFKLDRIEHSNTLKPLPVFGASFVPASGTFKFETRTVSIVDSANSEVIVNVKSDKKTEEKKITVRPVSGSPQPLANGKCELRFECENWIEEKDLEFVIQEKDSEKNVNPEIEYDSSSDKWSSGNRYGKVEQEQLIVRFNPYQLQVEQEYQVSVRRPEGAVLIDNTNFPPCKMTIKVNKAKLTNLQYGKEVKDALKFS